MTPTRENRDPAPDDQPRGKSSSPAQFPRNRTKALTAVLGIVGTAAAGILVPQILSAAGRVVRPPGPPLYANVITDIAHFRSGATHLPLFVIPRRPSAIGPPPDRYAAHSGDRSQTPDAARYAWAHALGGVDAGESLLRLSISGSSSAATDLQQLRVHIVRCRQPLAGTYVDYSGKGDAIGTRFFTVTLDRASPTVQYVSTNWRPDRHQPFPLRVTDSIQEEFDVSADVLHSDCEWQLLLDWTRGPHSGTMVIQDNGQPFRTTAADALSGGTSPGVTDVVWDPKRQRWTAPSGQP